MMHWPKSIPQGARISEPVSLLDVTATILDAADADTQAAHEENLDGTSVLPLVAGERTRENLICDHFGHSGDVLFQKILYQNRFKYTSVWGEDDEFYDLAADPYELINLIDDPAYLEDVISRLLP